MTSADYDLGYLRAGVADLEDYLLSQDLYWPLDAKPPQGDPPYLRLTLGGLLLAQARLRGWLLTTSQSAECDQLDRIISDIAYRWRIAWGEKATHEARACLHLWRAFLEEYRAEPEANYDRYAYEVRRRAILSLLLPQTDGISQEEFDLLNTLDLLLRKGLLGDEIDWEAQLVGGFSRDTHWFLYGRLKTEN